MLILAFFGVKYNIKVIFHEKEKFYNYLHSVVSLALKIRKLTFIFLKSMAIHFLITGLPTLTGTL